MAEHSQQGTGKHPHKSAEEPFEHNEASTTKGQGSKESSSHSSGSKANASSGSHNNDSESSDLKSREYTDKDGNIHHHTHTAGKSK